MWEFNPHLETNERVATDGLPLGRPGLPTGDGGHSEYIKRLAQMGLWPGGGLRQGKSCSDAGWRPGPGMRGVTSWSDKANLTGPISTFAPPALGAVNDSSALASAASSTPAGSPLSTFRSSPERKGELSDDLMYTGVLQPASTLASDSASASASEEAKVPLPVVPGPGPVVETLPAAAAAITVKVEEKKEEKKESKSDEKRAIPIGGA